jgi:hypothetical protein
MIDMLFFLGLKLKKTITADGLPEGRAARTQSHLEGEKPWKSV